MPPNPPDQPRNHPARLEAIAAALRAGRWEEAAALSDAALTDGLEHPLPLQALAEALRRAGRFEAAIELCRRRARLTPRDPAAFCALAACLSAARHPEAALEAYDAALSLAPADPEGLCGKAGVLQGLGRATEAMDLYRAALARTPDRFEAVFGLALLAVEAGNWDEAQDLATGLRTRHPDLPQATWLVSRVLLGRGDNARAQTALQPLIADPRIAPEQKADALLMLSQALDGLDRPADAFAAAIEGKAIQHGLFAERAAGREDAITRFERLSRWFASADPGPWRVSPPASPVPDEADGHVFLVGFPRSGTTLLEQVLAGHRRVVALEEAPTLAAAHAAFMGDAAGLERLARLSPNEAGLWRARYWAEVRGYGIAAPGRVFLDKAPAGTIDLPLVAKLFPKAKVLFALRDPRDVTLSCLRHNFQLNALTYAFTRLDKATAAYAACMTMAEVYRALLPLDLLEVRHEALVQDFDAELARIVAFLGLEPDPAMADVAATAARRQVRTPSAGQVRAGLNPRGLDRWRSYGPQLAPVMPTLEPWIRRFGYTGA